MGKKYERKKISEKYELVGRDKELLKWFVNTFWRTVDEGQELMSEKKFKAVKEHFKDIGFYTFKSERHGNINIDYLCKYMTSLKRYSKSEYDAFLLEYRDIVEDSIENVFKSRFFEYKHNSAFDMNTLRQLFKEGKINIFYTFENNVIKSIGSEISEIDKKNPVDMYPKARAMYRHFIIHVGGTNTGKTYTALQVLKGARNGIYLGPLRLLALEVQDTLNRDGYPCSMVTGEERDIISDAKYMSSTVEMLDISQQYDVIVIDECQMISDEFRGGSWTRAILGGLSHEIHLCTAPEGVDALCKLINFCGDTYEIVEHQRLVPLKWERVELEKADLSNENENIDYNSFIQKGDALIVFSRKKVLALAADLEEAGIKASVVYGALPYNSRKKQVEYFANGETDVVVATDAIGMGLNLPIKRIIFMESMKFDGRDIRPLKTSEIKQIAGRAGRYGKYDVGLVNSIIDRKYIKKNLETTTELIDFAYLNFPEELLKLPYSFDTILKSWFASNSPDLYRKEEISEMLFLYELNKKMFKSRHIDNREIYDLCSVPVDIKNDNVVNLWSDFCNEFLKKGYISKPEIKTNDLLELEDSYKLLDLYFAFSQKMQLICDEGWVREEKEKLSEAINNALLKETKKKHIRHCKKCGKPLPWFYRYGVCERCHYISDFK